MAERSQHTHRRQAPKLNAALDAAKHNVRVFPVWSVDEAGRCKCQARSKCKNPGKHPIGSLVPHGHDDATTDQNVIRQWWRKRPDANVGAVPGPNFAVLDPDAWKGEDQVLAELEAQHGPVPRGCVVLTGLHQVNGKQQRSEHVWLRLPKGASFTKTTIRGIELKSEGGYVLYPGSEHFSGVRYEFQGRSSLDDAESIPRWMLNGAVNEDQGQESPENQRQRTGLPLGKRSVRALERGLPEPEDEQTHREVAVGIARNFYEAGYHQDVVRVLMARILEHEDSALDASRPWSQQDLEEIVSSVVRDAAPDAEARRGRELQDLIEKRHQWHVADREAKLRLEAEGIKDHFPFPDPGWTLEDELQQPEPDLMFRVDRLQIVGGNVVLIAGYKLGKTTLEMNLMRSLADGTPFLGKYKVEQVDGRIAVWNYELTGEQWNRWARAMEIKNRDRVVPVHLRGKGIVPIWLGEYRKRIAAWMVQNEIKYWILDPTAKAWEGLIESEGDNIGAGRFLNAIDEVKDLSGIPEANLTHHTGRAKENQERGRGATRLDDWADAAWHLTGERDDLWFDAVGRDVDLEKIRVAYNEDNARSFTTTGLTKDQAQATEGAMAALRATIELEQQGVEKNERSSARVIEQMSGNKTNRDRWLRQAAENGWIKRDRGSRGAKLVSSTQLGRRMHEKRGDQ